MLIKSDNLTREDVKDILNTLDEMFPHAGCELIYHNIFELLIAVVLSAQTTDKAVNKITPALFEKYPDAFLLANATTEEVAPFIKPIGLYRNKSKNIINIAKELVIKHNGKVPSNFDELVALPGVGRKTANVVLSEGFKENRIAVDTHVERVSKRLGIAEQSHTPYEVELKLMNLIDESKWHHSHHLLLFFGRYFCKATKPNCDKCFYRQKCKRN